MMQPVLGAAPAQVRKNSAIHITLTKVTFDELIFGVFGQSRSLPLQTTKP
jgi:hypothetical protein